MISTNSDYSSNAAPLASDMRLSRLSHPRATVAAMLLLATVFLLFGMFVNAMEPDHVVVPEQLSGTLVSVEGWLASGLGVLDL